LGGEGWEVVLRLILDFIEEYEEMVKVEVLVQGLTTPQEVDRGKHKVMRRLCGSKVDVADMADGMYPDSLYLWKPSWRWSSISEAYQLWVIRLGGQGGHTGLGLFGIATSCLVHQSESRKCRMALPLSFILFYTFSSLHLNPLVRLKVSKHSM